MFGTAIEYDDLPKSPNTKGSLAASSRNPLSVRRLWSTSRISPVSLVYEFPENFTQSLRVRFVPFIRGSPHLPLFPKWARSRMDPHKLSYNSRSCIDLRQVVPEWNPKHLARPASTSIAFSIRAQIPSSELLNVQDIDLASLSESDSESFSASKERALIVQEILRSEANYIQDLHILCDIYYKKIQESAVLLDEKTTMFFDGLGELLVKHESLFSLLHHVVQSWDHNTSTVGRVFLQQTEFVGPTAQVVSKYRFARDCVDRLTKLDPSFKILIQNTYRSLGDVSKTIENLMITPVQRIPRYELLLRELAKNTPSKHLDFALLERAIQKVQDAARLVDQSIVDEYQELSLDPLLPRINLKKVSGKGSSHPPFLGKKLIAQTLVATLTIIDSRHDNKKKKIKNPLLILTDDAILGCSAQSRSIDSTSASNTTKLQQSKLKVYAVWRILSTEIESESTVSLTIGGASHIGKVTFLVAGVYADFIEKFNRVKVSKLGLASGFSVATTPSSQQSSPRPEQLTQPEDTHPSHMCHTSLVDNKDNKEELQRFPGNEKNDSATARCHRLGVLVCFEI